MRDQDNNKSFYINKKEIFIFSGIITLSSSNHIWKSSSDKSARINNVWHDSINRYQTISSLESVADKFHSANMIYLKTNDVRHSYY